MCFLQIGPLGKKAIKTANAVAFFLFFPTKNMQVILCLGPKYDKVLQK
jgi:hypothetical protein